MRGSFWLRSEVGAAADDDDHDHDQWRLVPLLYVIDVTVHLCNCHNRFTCYVGIFDFFRLSSSVCFTSNTNHTLPSSHSSQSQTNPGMLRQTQTWDSYLVQTKTDADGEWCALWYLYLQQPLLSRHFGLLFVINSWRLAVIEPFEKNRYVWIYLTDAPSAKNILCQCTYVATKSSMYYETQHL